jgi:hypothetical protein
MNSGDSGERRQPCTRGTRRSELLARGTRLSAKGSAAVKIATAA